MSHPSFEAEVKFGDRWLEVLGCGVIHGTILQRLGIQRRGWAFGLGLERLAMILFEIPDIRLFWSQDPHFLQQFASEDMSVKFQPWAKLAPVVRDCSLFVPDSQVHRLTPTSADAPAHSESPAHPDNPEDPKNAIPWQWLAVNDFYEILREACGDLIESVTIKEQTRIPQGKHKDK